MQHGYAVFGSILVLSAWSCTSERTPFRSELGRSAQRLRLPAVHGFGGPPDDGASPQGAPVVIGSTVYGVTWNGGANRTGLGTLYRVNTDGTGFALLHSFWSDADGFATYPIGSLVVSGSALFGLTAVSESGGSTIFKANLDGTGFGMVGSFGSSATDVQLPRTLVVSGSTLYGGAAGGTAQKGTIFRINTDGTGLEILHSFTGIPDDGDGVGSLTLVGSTLYGMTSRGGAVGLGTLFKLNTDGSGYSVLHSFDGMPGHPDGSIAVSGTTLYGHSYGEGPVDFGTVFKIGTDGTGLTVLHSFTAPNFSDGVILVGSTLYGTTDGFSGGSSDLFSLGTDGAEFTSLHRFTDEGDFGSQPGGITAIDGTIYGTTAGRGRLSDGGTADGVLYKFALACGPNEALADGACVLLDAGAPEASAPDAAVDGAVNDAAASPVDAGDDGSVDASAASVDAPVVARPPDAPSAPTEAPSGAGGCGCTTMSSPEHARAAGFVGAAFVVLGASRRRRRRHAA